MSSFIVANTPDDDVSEVVGAFREPSCGRDLHALAGAGGILFGKALVDSLAGGDVGEHHVVSVPGNQIDRDSLLGGPGLVEDIVPATLSTNTAAASIARSCNLLVMIAPFRFRVGPSAQRLVARGTQGIRHRAREKAKSTWKAIAEASFRKVFQPLIQTSWRRVFEKCRGLCAGGGLSALLT